MSDRGGFVVIMENDHMIVSVCGVTELVKNHFNDYIRRLSDPNERNLRMNFKKKMEFVCRK